MSHRQITMLIGVWVIAFLFLGFSLAWEQVFAVITGLVIVIMAYRTAPIAKTTDESAVPFVEHKSPSQKVESSAISEIQPIPADKPTDTPITGTDHSMTT
ncbi:MAG: hypothetical protein WCG07_00020 [Candidatus Taylorbacteria bacterium]